MYEILRSLKDNNEDEKEYEIVSSKCTNWTTDPSFILTNDTSQFVTFNNKNSFLQINLKKKIDIYGYRINSSANCYRYMKNWVLLGSIDKINWIILDEHSDDNSLQSNDLDTIDFTVYPHGIQFNSIKLVQTGKNNKSDYILAIRYFDIIGKIYN